MWDFAEIYRENVDAVFRYALHCVRRRDLAEDITSETFLALYRNRETVEQSQLPAWLFTVAKNRAVDYWRHSAVEKHYAPQAPEESSVSDPESAFETWLLESKALKPVHRVCLTLRYVHGMTRAEIARNIGLSENQVKGYVQYALQLLRKELVKGPHEPRAETSLD